MIYVPDVFLFMENKKKQNILLLYATFVACHSLITNHAHDKHCCFPDIDSSIEKRTIDIYDIITMTLEKLIFVLATHSDNTEKW